jgi:hypothetical protein
MKKILIAVLLLVSVMAKSQSKTDTTAIKETVLNYIEGYYNADWQRMTKALHPEMAKRIIIKDSLGNNMLQNMGASTLIYYTRKAKTNNGLSPNQPFKADIIIYDIYNNVATVKVSTNKFKFIDYIHLGKFGEEWRIVNVLWEYLK